MLIAIINFLHNLLSQIQESTSGNTIRIQSDRFSFVTTFADTLNNRNLSQQWNMQFFCQTLSAFFTEKIILVFRKFGRSKPGHVFNQSQYRNIHLISCKHTDSFTGICQSHFLRCTDNNCPSNCQRLHHGQMNITCSRR